MKQCTNCTLATNCLVKFEGVYYFLLKVPYFDTDLKLV